jgi:hypothetical protein
VSALRAPSTGRLGRRHVLAAFSVATGAVVGVAVGVVLLVAVNRSSLCQPYKPCGPVHAARPLVNETPWRSSQFGFSLQYAAGQGLTIIEQDPAGVQLTDPQGSIFRVRGSSQPPTAAIASELSSLRANISSLTSDTNPQDTLLGPNVGYQVGRGGAFTGTFNSPQGAGGTTVNVAIQSAATGSVTITATAIYANQQGGMSVLGEQQTGDQIFNTVQWAGH